MRSNSHIPFGAFRVNRASAQAKGLLAWWPALGSRGCNVWYDRVHGISLANSGGVYDVSVDTLGWAKNWATDDIYAAATGAPFLTAVGTQLTIAAWVRITSGSTGNRHIFSVTTNSSAAIAYQVLRSNTGLWFYVGATSQATGLVFSDTAWKHIVCRYDGQNLQSYLNGVEVGTPAAYSSVVSVGTENIPAIGARTSAANYWRGDIADVRVYGRVLSAAEIWQLYAPETRWALYDTGRMVAVRAPVATPTVSPPIPPVVRAITGSEGYVEFDGVAISSDQLDFDPGMEGVLEDNTAIQDTLVNYISIRERVRPTLRILIHDDAQGRAIQAVLQQGHTGELIWGFFGNASGDPKWGITAEVVRANVAMKHDDLQVLDVDFANTANVWLYDGRTETF